MSQVLSLRLRGAAAALWCAASAALILGAGFGAAEAADLINVTLDQAKVLQLPEKTATVIVGNPVIADVTMLKRNDTIVLTGKGFGETNLIALDAQGKALGESIVRVTPAENVLIVQRGMDRESYACSPKCQPIVNLGDTTKYVTDIASQIQSRNTLVQPGH
jgi:Flp pilus assembly secretin CpaC